MGGFHQDSARHCDQTEMMLLSVSWKVVSLLECNVDRLFRVFIVNFKSNIDCIQRESNMTSVINFFVILNQSYIQQCFFSDCIILKDDFDLVLIYYASTKCDNTIVSMMCDNFIVFWVAFDSISQRFCNLFCEKILLSKTTHKYSLMMQCIKLIKYYLLMQCMKIEKIGDCFHRIT